MKLLHVVPTYLPAVEHGGPIRAVHGLARALVERGHEVTVFTTNLHGRGIMPVPTNRPVSIDGVSVRYFEAGRPRRLARAPAMSAALQREVSAFDMVHLHSIFLWPTNRAARAAERANVPWVVSPRGMLVRDLFARRGSLRKSIWLRWVESRTLTRAARILATSELEAEEMRRFPLRFPPIELLPNGVDIPGSDGPATEVGSDARLIFLGRISWKKRIDRLIEALARVPGVHLDVVGNDEEGAQAKLGELAVRLGVGDRVHFPGFVEGEAKSARIAGARALLLPSYSENFGNVVLEAWALGVPVLVSPGVGLAGEVASAGAGLVVESEVETLAEAIREILGDPVAAREMGSRGRQLVERQFSWAGVAARAEAIYENVVREGARAR